MSPPTTPPAPLPPLFIVFDAATGGPDVLAASERVAALLRAAGQPHVLHRVRQAPELAALAVRAVHEARAAGGIVVVAGGDAALNTVAQAVFNAGLPLAVLPLPGVASGFARLHGLPRALDAAVAALLAARPRTVPVGRVNGQLFLLHARVGFDPRVWPPARQGAGLAWRCAALRQCLRALGRGAGRLTLQWQQAGDAGEPTRVRHARALCVSPHAPPAAPGQPPVPALAEGPLAEGALAAVSLPPAGPLALLWMALRGAVGPVAAGGWPCPAGGGVEAFRFTRLRIAPRPRWRQWQVLIDGEVRLLEAPLLFEPAPRPLHVWLPPGPAPD